MSSKKKGKTHAPDPMDAVRAERLSKTDWKTVSPGRLSVICKLLDQQDPKPGEIILS